MWIKEVAATVQFASVMAMAMSEVDTSSSALSLDSEEHIMLDDMMDIPMMDIPPSFELLGLKSLGADPPRTSIPYFNITCNMYPVPCIMYHESYHIISDQQYQTLDQQGRNNGKSHAAMQEASSWPAFST